MFWNRIISLSLNVLLKLIYEVYWFCCLLICKNQNKANFAWSSFSSMAKLRWQQRYAALCGVSGVFWAPKAKRYWTFNWPEIERPGKYFFRGGIRRIGNQEFWIINDTIALVVLRYLFCYESTDPNTNRKRWLKIQLVRMKTA